MFLYDDAYRIKRELQDEEMWVNGMYTMEAFRVVLTNAFSQKGAKPVEYRDKSLLQELKDKNRVLTEEEKQEQINLLFSSLAVMQTNFEKAHGDKHNA